MPDWAFLSTWSMRTSLCFTRSCVFSISPERLSTFVLTSPTSLPTYFLVAQPDRATPSPTTRQGTMMALIGDLLLRWFTGERFAPKRLSADGSGQDSGT